MRGAATVKARDARASLVRGISMSLLSDDLRLRVGTCSRKNALRCAGSPVCRILYESNESCIQHVDTLLIHLARIFVLISFHTTFGFSFYSVLSSKTVYSFRSKNNYRFFIVFVNESTLIFVFI